MSKSSQHTKDNVIESFKDIIPLSLARKLVMQPHMVLLH